MVTLRFDLVARNANEGKANQELQAKANKVFALLKAEKIGENDVVASDLKSEPQFEHEGSIQKGKLIGYSVARTFAVKARDVHAFAKLLDELLPLGGVEVSKVEPGLTKQKEIEAEIFEKALTNAREQAEKTVKSMDMKIDSVFAVSQVPFPEIQSRMIPGVEYSSERVIVTGSYIPTGENAVSQYRVAPLTVSQSVHVIYLISPAK